MVTYKQHYTIKIDLQSSPQNKVKRSIITLLTLLFLIIIQKFIFLNFHNYLHKNGADNIRSITNYENISTVNNYTCISLQNISQYPGSISVSNKATVITLIIYIGLITLINICVYYLYRQKHKRKLKSIIIQQHKFLNNVFDATNTGVFILDSNSEVIINANNIALKISEYERDEIIGRNVDEIILNPTYDMVSEDNLSNIDGQLLTKKGNYIRITRNVFKIVSDDIPFIVESFVDITKRIEYEKAINDAKEAAENISKSKSQFIANMSHEFRTPMNAIIGISKALLKYDSASLNKEQIEGITHITNSGQRLLNLVNDLLDLSKIESGRETINFAPFSLEKLIIELKSTVEELIRDKNIRFLVRKNHNIPETIVSDSRKLYQILLNLLGNAAKFTEKGHIQLLIYKLRSFLYFEIEDTGVGIENEKIDMVFNRFIQIDNTIQKRFKGTGLGLALCKELVELLNGEIVIRSEINKGTTVIFYIPYYISEKEIQNGTIEKSDLANKNHGRNSYKTILILDEDVQTLYFYSNSLKEEGNYRIITARNGEEALKSLANEIPDIILLDLKLPKISGYDILRKVKYNKRLCSVPVIIITEHEFAPNKTIYNYNEFYKKPVNISSLKLNIKKLTSDGYKKNFRVQIVSEDIEELNFLIQAVSNSQYLPITVQDSKKAYPIATRLEPQVIIYDNISSSLEATKFHNLIRKSKLKQLKDCFIIISGKKPKIIQDERSVFIKRTVDSKQKINDIIADVLNCEHRKINTSSILIAEGNLGNITQLKQILSNKYHLFIANNGPEAIDYFNKKHPDLVLLDTDLPIINGFKTFDKLRKNNISTPIIAITSNTSKNDFKRILDYGFNDYLLKPVNENLLVTKIKNYLL